MIHIPKHLIPALGLAIWGMIVMLVDRQDFTFYLLVSTLVSFATGVMYRKANDAAKQLDR